MNAPIETAPLPATERAARQPQAVAALARCCPWDQAGAAATELHIHDR